MKSIKCTLCHPLLPRKKYFENIVSSSFKYTIFITGKITKQSLKKFQLNFFDFSLGLITAKHFYLHTIIDFFYQCSHS